MESYLSAFALSALLAGLPHASAQNILFSSNFDGTAGATVLAAGADNSSGSNNVTVGNWQKDPAVTTISQLTKINTNNGVTADGGFVQLFGGSAPLANGNGIFINENINQGNTPRRRGFSFTFTLNEVCHLESLSILSGHANGNGADQNYTTLLVYALTGGTLTSPITGSSSENHDLAPVYHDVRFELSGNELGPGTYSLEIYQTGVTNGSFAIFDGVTLSGQSGNPPPLIESFAATPRNFEPGQTVTLSWSVSGANSVTIDNGIGPVPATGTTTVNPTTTTTYTLTASEGTKSSTSSVTLRESLGEVDVYILSGQSNMFGIARIADLSPQDLVPPPNVFYWNGTAFEPYDPSTTQTSYNGNFGPENSFARAISNPNRRSYIIKYANPGMGLDPGWTGNDGQTWLGDPPAPNRVNFFPGTSATDPNQGILYKNELLPRCLAGIAALEDMGYIPAIRRFLWVQGEQDSKQVLSAGRYAANLKLLRDRLAGDLGLAGPTDLPMVFAQVLPYSPTPSQFVWRDLLRAQQASADMDSGSPDAIPFARMISTDGYSLNSDHIHYDAAAQIRLGDAMSSPRSYQEWAIRMGVTGSPSDDDDFDGLNNVIEFHFGTDPRNGTSRIAPDTAIETMGGQDYLTLSYRRALDALAPPPVALISEDLLEWNEEMSPVLVEDDVQGDEIFLKYRAPWPVSDPIRKRAFMRLGFAPAE